MHPNYLIFCDNLKCRSRICNRFWLTLTWSDSALNSTCFYQLGNCIFTFFCPCMEEKVLILGQIFEMMDLHGLRSSESENHILNGWSVCLYVWLSPVSVIIKETTEEILNLAFYICIICRWYLKLFMKIRLIVCVQGHTK